MKKLVLGLMFVFLIPFISAHALTETETQQLIQTLTAQIAALQAQIQAIISQGVTVTPGATSNIEDNPSGNDSGSPSTAVSTTLRVGDTVRALSNLNVRSSPVPLNTTATPLAQITAGSIGRLVIGPNTAQDGSKWWQITWANGINGWSAQNFIAKTTIPAPTPTANNYLRFVYPAGGETLTQGQPYNIRWTGGDDGVTSYSVYLSNGWNGVNTYVGTALQTEKDVNGFQLIIPQNITGNGYQLRFVSGPITATNTTGGFSGSFNIIANNSGPVPTVNLIPTPPTIAPGGSSVLNLSTQNATNCTGIGFNPNGVTYGTFTVSPTQSTTYTVNCTNSFGQSMSAAAMVTVNNQTTNTIPAPTVTFTNNGSSNSTTVNSGSSVNFNWSATNINKCQLFKNGVMYNDGLYNLFNTNANTPTYNSTFYIGNITAGATYTLTCTGVGGTQSATMVVNIATTQTQTSVPATPSTPSGTAGACGTGQATLSWSAVTGATSYRVMRSIGNGYGSPISVSGTSYTDSGLSAGTTYYYVVQAVNSVGVSGNSNYATVVAPSACANSPLTPTASLSINSSFGSGSNTATAGTYKVLNWSSTNATSCSAPWMYGSATSGSQSVGPINQTTTYTVTCVNSTGSATSNVTISVGNTSVPLPNISLTLSRSTQGVNTIGWTATDATRCSAPWASGTGSSGYADVYPTATTNYVMTCFNSAGQSSTRDITVTVTTSQSLPTVNLNVNSSYNFGGQTTATPGTLVVLDWSSTNATSCSAPWISNNPYVAGNTYGSQSIGYVYSTNTYTVTCTGAGGTASKSITITVSNTQACSDTSTTQTLACPSGQTGSITQTRTMSAYPTCGGAWTTSSNTCQTTTTQQTAIPAVPSGSATAGACATGKITVSWGAVSGATRYYVYRNGALLGNMGTNTSYDDTGLTAGTNYSYSVSAGNLNGDSAQGSAGSATAPAASCSTSSGTRSVSLTSAQTTLSPGQYATVFWSSSPTSANYCSGNAGYSSTGSGWSNVYPAAPSSTYTITCYWQDGGSASASYTIYVTGSSGSGGGYQGGGGGTDDRSGDLIYNNNNQSSLAGVNSAFEAILKAFQELLNQGN